MARRPGAYPTFAETRPRSGYATFHVEVDGFTFRFASLAELDHCVEILSQRVLPTSRRLSEIRGIGYGPNNQWLSRLPKGTKNWKYRQKAVAYLKVARKAFVEATGQGSSCPAVADEEAADTFGDK